ncbi:MAG: SusE domain-containing protein [Bacteroidales bacterium]|nr:SusE domain-containing protein [Bacteroidales bacterium]MBQ8812572.1 SusE domain-containing protein [Bacteroidales bacterium]
MKITRYLLSMAAATGLVAACQTPEMVQVDFSQAIAPVMHDIDSAGVKNQIIITADNQTSEVTFTWDAADFGVKTQVDYSVEAALGDSDKVILLAGITTTEGKQTYEAVNQVLYNDLFKKNNIPEGVLTDVNFYIAAAVGEAQKLYSEPLVVKVAVTAAEKQYPKLTVAGSYAYNNWTPGKGQYVFDFEVTDTRYSGIIDFGEDVSALQFKFVGSAWGENEYSVPGGEAQAAEADELQLVAGGGDNISAYTTHRYYNFTLDKSVPKVIKNFSFNQIGVIGDFNGWGADVVMEFNASKQKFYADVEFPADGGFKFRLDGAWDVSYGSTGSGILDSGDNIPVKAGNYRVYLNMNNPEEMTYDLNADMYGQEEPVEGGGTTPEPTPTVQGWGLVGEYNGWGETPDVMLASDGTYLAVKGVELSGQVKFRKDGGWDVNFGAPGDVEPVEIAVNTELELAAGGKNFTIAAGTYDVYLDEANAKAWFINDGSYPGGGAAMVESEWGLIGSLAACNSWSNNIKLFVDGDYFVAKGVVFAANDQFKFRKGETWGTELVYEGTVMPDAEYACAAGGGNSTIGEAGTYDVYLAASLDKFYVMTQGKTPADAGEAVVTYLDPTAESFIVGFSGSAIQWDDPSFDQGDRATFVSKNLTDEKKFAGTYEFKLENFAIAVDDQFKLRINGQWIGDGGAVVEGLPVTAASDGNFIAGEAGTYTATITFTWDGSAHSDAKVVFSK